MGNDDLNRLYDAPYGGLIGEMSLASAERLARQADTDEASVTIAERLFWAEFFNKNEVVVLEVQGTRRVWLVEDVSNDHITLQRVKVA